MTIDELLDSWPGNIPFKGQLISEDGSCMCAQGQVLHLIGGMSPDDLREIAQIDADVRVAKLLGISRAHAVLLRTVNDGQPGAPTGAIREPEKVLGSQAQTLLAFWRHLDRMTKNDWTAARTAAGTAARTAAWTAARIAAWDAACDAAGALARNAAWDAAWDAAEAAAPASCEIQGAAIMRERNQPFFFLTMFGFADPEAVLAADKENVK